MIEQSPAGANDDGGPAQQPGAQGAGEAIEEMDEEQRAILAEAEQAEAATPLFETAENSAANLAEEQESYLAEIRAEPTTENVRVVRINVDALRDEAVRLEPAPQQSFVARKVTEEAAAGAGYTWIGELAEQPGEAVLVVNGDRVTGNIRAGGELFQVRPIGGGLHAVIQIDQGAFPPEHPPEFEEIERQGSLLDPAALPPEEAAADAQPRQLDVLVAYTPAVRAKVADVDALIALAIAENNLANRNSGVNLRVNLVDSYETAYAESGNFGTDVARFRNRNDNYMDEVHARRDQNGADMAVLIMNNGQYCGLASAILATEATAFAGVHYTCATGNYTFTHELGHLQGARHNPEVDSSTSPFAHGHGYYRQAKRDRTVMSYDCPGGCTRVPYWSNPNVSYNGAAIGTAATHDNSRVLNHTASVVTNFRSPPLLGVIGYAWAHNPTASSYTPSASYAHNSAKGDIEITRSGPGRYAVRFQGLGGNGTAGGNVQVTAYGNSSHHCKVGSWSSGGPDFVANIRCVDSGGNLSDTYYTVYVRWP